MRRNLSTSEADCKNKFMAAKKGPPQPTLSFPVIMGWQGHQGQERIVRNKLGSASPEYLIQSPGDCDNRGNTKIEREQENRLSKENNSTSSELPQTCVYCNKTFPCKDSLKSHVRTIHQGKKYYDCSLCHKQFTHRSSRNIHMRVHTNQRPYECQVCKKCFRVMSHLRDHLRTHTGERPYKCPICGRGFKQSSDMKKHRKTHNKTSLSNNNNHKTKQNETSPQNSPKTSYMIVKPDQPTRKTAGKPNGETNLITERNDLKLVIKLERKPKEMNVASPKSCDSGVKIESDRSSSPDNVPRENKPWFQDSVLQMTPAANSVIASSWSAVLACDKNISKDLRTQSAIYAETNQNRVSLNEINVKSESIATSCEMNAEKTHSFSEFLFKKDINNSECNVKKESEKETTTDCLIRANSSSPQSLNCNISERERNGPSIVDQFATTNPTISTATGNSPNNERPSITLAETSGQANNLSIESPLSEMNNCSETTDKECASLKDNDTGVVAKQKFVIQPLTNNSLRNFLAKKQVKQTNKGCEENMQCSECLGTFQTPELFSTHKCEKNEKVFKCSICTKVFARGTLLRQHMVLHQGSKRFKFKCNYCGRAFRHRSHLRDHERIHTGERPFKCSFCPKAFKQSSDLRKHENLHTGATRYRCERCKVEFKRCDALKKHAMLHAEGEVTLLKCVKCKSLFATADGQSSHLCNNKNRFRCQLCVKRFSSGAALRQHCHQDHADQSNYTDLKCEFCKLKLQSLNALELHLETHQLNKTHKCNNCDQRFSLICQLEEHIKCHHPKPETNTANKSISLTMNGFSDQNQFHPRQHEDNEMKTSDISEPSPNFQKVHDNTMDMNTAIPIPDPVHTIANEITMQRKYDFIPSSYQSLLEISPYVYMPNKPWDMPSKMEPGMSSIPHLIRSEPSKSQAHTQLASTRCLDDEPMRTNSSDGNKFWFNERRNETEHADDPRWTDTNEHDSLSNHQVAKRKYTCLNCRQEYYNETNLMGHICDIQSECVFQCTTCDTEFVHYEDLQEHMKKHWKTVVYLKCSQCGERVKNEELLKQHNYKHIENDRANRLTGLEYENNNLPTLSTVSTQADRTRIRKPENGVFLNTTISPITSYTTPVITSVSGKEGTKATSSSEIKSNRPSGKNFGRHQYPESSDEPKTTPISSQNSGTFLERSFTNNQPDDVTRVSPYATYFDPRKSVPRPYVDVFGQPPAIMVSAMHTMYQHAMP